MNLLSGVLVFSRVVIGLALMISGLSKLGDFGSFKRTVADFRILPTYLHKIAAFGFLFFELVVVLLMLLNGKFLLWGFILATFLLCLFTSALVLVLVRGIQVGCNCFSSTNKPVTRYDVVRNLGLIFFGILGWMGALAPKGNQISVMESVLLIFLASVFVILWVSLREIMDIFHNI